MKDNTKGKIITPVERILQWDGSHYLTVDGDFYYSIDDESNPQWIKVIDPTPTN